MNRIDDQAVAWVAREDRGPLDARERGKRDGWLLQDARHLGAYARAHAVFADMERASALGRDVDLGTFAPRDKKRRTWRLPLATIAATAACLLVAVLAWHPGAGHYATRLGEVLRVPLDDGSVVTLNSGSEVEIDFDRGIRRVVLQRGEALFDVAKDPQRPFVVDAGVASVTAIGTSFSVLRGKGRNVEILVREGIVEVDGDGTQASPKLVTANSTAAAHAGHVLQIVPLRPDEVVRRLAWRDGMLAFDGDTLQQAAEEFARYSDIRIVIDDPEVASRRVVGLYSATDPAGFARAVATSMSLQVEATESGVYLRRKGGSAPDNGGTQPPAHRLL